MGMWEKERSRIMSNILLLEDDLSLINGLSFALRKQGYGLEVMFHFLTVPVLKYAKKSARLQKYLLFF